MATATKVKPTKEQLKRDLNLSELPSDRFMELLEELGDSPYLTTPNPRSEPDEEWTPERIEAVVQDMFLAKSIGELLEEARKQSDMTMNDVAEKMQVSRGRINQLEQPDANLEIATITRVAQAMGYHVTMTLEPKSKNKKPLKVELK